MTMTLIPQAFQTPPLLQGLGLSGQKISAGLEALHIFEGYTVVGLVAADPFLNFEGVMFTGEPQDVVRIQVALLRADGKKCQAAMPVNVEFLRMFNLAGEQITTIVG